MYIILGPQSQELAKASNNPPPPKAQDNVSDLCFFNLLNNVK